MPARPDPTTHRDVPGPSALAADAPPVPVTPATPEAVVATAVTDPVSARDVEVLTEQLGRPPRGVVGVAARCVCGRPLVVRTAPRLDDGTPFPTTYYLTSPQAVAAVSAVEASGVMKELTARLAEDEELAAGHRRAHEAYLADREALGHVPEIEGISAGGMPHRVKCLHVLVAHALAAGPGVNPVGDEVLATIADRWRPDRCTC
ncbi:DUF501 domain-containing protein [Cellulomonas wangsupingiae]|uniref:DUF501 domain-containing protein n=1 Tax=Cellulomonas wangsupingiae TaxID=2968085 RepID=A0ABY5K6G0_9CELL|nr:DUF501 domain-containing protein [Cellulomonas wangsupingiae]MCC2334363.1 DUF501 domain-containing protein [Cellulomonas wangsupingiae]UUI66034.1 DUF501 domain-containing protein [Cellulomonas wangsupingiae]